MTAARPVIVSHRGLGFGHPENTLVAFSAARARGGIGVELDARITRDDVSVVCHDPDVRLADGRRARIADVGAAALAGVVPRLGDALRALADVLVDLEIKPTKASIDPVLREIGSARVRISSFSATVLEQARAKAPEIERALLLEPDEELPRSIAVAARVRASGVHAHRALLSPAHVQSWRAAGLSVRAYTLNTAEEWAYARDLGVDAIITDRPLELEVWLGRADGRHDSG